MALPLFSFAIRRYDDDAANHTFGDNPRLSASNFTISETVSRSGESRAFQPGICADLEKLRMALVPSRMEPCAVTLSAPDASITWLIFGSLISP